MLARVLKLLCFDIIPSFGDVGSDLLNGIDMLGVNASIFNTTITDDIYRQDTIWGTVGIVLIFAPGIPLAIGFLIEDIRDPVMWLVALLVVPCYPFVMVFLQLRALWKPNADLSNIVLAVSFEGYFESNPQMLLQMFTIQYGYEVTTLQITTILISFILAAKTAVMFDLKIATSTDFDDWKDTAKYVALVLPVYTTASVFRIGSLSIITAYLRYWSLLPIAIRAVIYGILAWYVGYDNNEIPIAAFSNLGSMTRGTEPSDDTDVDTDIKVSSKFLFLSTISTFVIETVFLVCILVTTIASPTFYDHWQTGLVYFGNTTAIISSIIGVGILNLLLLFVTRKKLQLLDVTSENQDSGTPEIEMDC